MRRLTNKTFHSLNLTNHPDEQQQQKVIRDIDLELIMGSSVAWPEMIIARVPFNTFNFLYDHGEI